MTRSPSRASPRHIVLGRRLLSHPRLGHPLLVHLLLVHLLLGRRCLCRLRIWPAPRPSLQALARSHPLETIAVLLLGVGGLILPPLWLAGGLVAAVSRIWDARDKWLALLGPPLFVLAGLLLAGLGGGHHGFFGGFRHAFDAYRDYLIRGGAVFTAGYLAWRIRRGPRMRSLPPWQRPRRGPIR